MNDKFYLLIFNVAILHILLCVVVTLVPLRFIVVVLGTLGLYLLSVGEVFFIVFNGGDKTNQFIDDVLKDVRLPLSYFGGLILCTIAYFIIDSLTVDFKDTILLVDLLTMTLILVTASSINAKKLILMIYIYFNTKTESQDT